MHWLLDFFSDLILFTAGLAVFIFWIICLVVVAIEAHDIVVEHYLPSTRKNNEEEEN